MGVGYAATRDSTWGTCHHNLCLTLFFWNLARVQGQNSVNRLKEFFANSGQTSATSYVREGTSAGLHWYVVWLLIKVRGEKGKTFMFKGKNYLNKKNTKMFQYLYTIQNPEMEGA